MNNFYFNRKRGKSKNVIRPVSQRNRVSAAPIVCPKGKAEIKAYVIEVFLSLLVFYTQIFMEYLYLSVQWGVLLAALWGKISVYIKKYCATFLTVLGKFGL